MTTEHPSTPPEIPAAAPTPPGGDTTLDEATHAILAVLGWIDDRVTRAQDERGNHYRAGHWYSVAEKAGRLLMEREAAIREVFTARHAAEVEAARLDGWNKGVRHGQAGHPAAEQRGREQAAQAIEYRAAEVLANHYEKLPYIAGHYAGLKLAADLARGATPTGDAAERTMMVSVFPSRVGGDTAPLDPVGYDLPGSHCTACGGSGLRDDQDWRARATPTPAGGEAESRVLAAARAWRARCDDTGPDRADVWADAEDLALIAAVDAMSDSAKKPSPDKGFSAPAPPAEEPAPAEPIPAPKKARGRSGRLELGFVAGAVVHMDPASPDGYPMSVYRIDHRWQSAAVYGHRLDANGQLGEQVMRHISSPSQYRIVSTGPAPTSGKGGTP